MSVTPPPHACGTCRFFVLCSCQRSGTVNNATDDRVIGECRRYATRPQIVDVDWNGLAWAARWSHVMDTTTACGDWQCETLDIFHLILEDPEKHGVSGAALDAVKVAIDAMTERPT